MRIVIINGSNGVGKDTFVKYCAERYPFGTVRLYSSIAEIKRFATFMGWEGQKTDKDRKFLSDLKNICTEWRDIPMQSIRQAVTRYSNSHYSCEVLFLMVREPNEIDRIVQEYENKFEVKTLLITRKSATVSNNSADMGVYDYPYNFVISNDGTLEDLRASAETFMERILYIHANS